MFLLLFIATILIVYIVIYKDDYNKENLNKVAPVLCAAVVVILVLCILGSLLGGQ